MNRSWYQVWRRWGHKLAVEVYLSETDYTFESLTAAVKKSVRKFKWTALLRCKLTGHNWKPSQVFATDVRPWDIYEATNRFQCSRCLERTSKVPRKLLRRKR